MGKTAIILGSTGLTGSFLLNILLNSEEYTSVVTFVRKITGTSHPKMTEHVINFDKPDEYKNLVVGDDLFCCLGTTIKKAGSKENFRRVDFTYPTTFAQIASEKGVKQFLIITAIASNPNSSTFYSRTKGECEEALKKMLIPSIAVFRPSIIVGERKEVRVLEKLSEYLGKCLAIFLFGKWKKLKPIEARKIASAMYNVANSETKKGFQIYESDEIEKVG